jgi:Na+-driven multidrug efflux pump
MNVDLTKDNDALNGEIFPTFVRYLIPSVLGLIAMTSSSLVDGIFIGNYVGITALAAVNLIIPIITILFGVSMMMSIGGSVRGGKYLGEGNKSAASSIFSKSLIFMTLYGIASITLTLVFEEQIFSSLGATEELFPVMSEYYRIIMPFVIFQLIIIPLYFFIRLDGLPNLAAIALGVGAVVNIALDYLFIAVYDWGLTGAAWATGISEVLSLLVILFYFFMPERTLSFSFRQNNWMEVFQAAYNGISEFINEVSGAIIAFIFNWMLIQRAGVDGVAAITVVNYMLMTGFMMFFAIEDTSQVMISQNLEFVTYVWPIFIFAGFNMMITGYLTAIHLPFQSALLAMSRGLILPTGLLILFYSLLSDFRFIAALSIAEGIAFILAIALFLRYSPQKAISAARG